VGKGGSCETNECRETESGEGKENASCAVKRALLSQESSQEV
jgi:hypothetical protein